MSFRYGDILSECSGGSDGESEFQFSDKTWR